MPRVYGERWWETRRCNMTVSDFLLALSIFIQGQPASFPHDADFYLEDDIMVEFSDQEDELFWTLEEPLRPSTLASCICICNHCCRCCVPHSFSSYQVMVPKMHHLASCLPDSFFCTSDCASPTVFHSEKCPVRSLRISMSGSNCVRVRTLRVSG